ncbi:ATP-binding protein [Polynucleobacter sp. Fuers-14]|uniref:ATP-binding protein n=1 Tax=Polynucleobacter sp. Fuers-14 TaxID=1758364 RepID=UPI001C0E37FE|nr:ATP-binding protein [Polynucleobacter sp. Fuers-14]MBU3641682.1 sensor histidine kinase [Polynucleobacter sp. Fuers-14]
MMEIRKLLKTSAFRAPWPTRIGGDVVASLMQEPSICKKCKTHSCVTERPMLLGSVCSDGLTYFGTSVSGIHLVIYGLTSLSNREVLGKKFGTQRKHELKGRAISQSDVNNWIESIKQLDKILQEERDLDLGEKLEALHETPKLAEEIKIAAEYLIQGKPGVTLEEKFNASSRIEKTIFKASQILVDTFDLLTVFLNPDSAGLGELISVMPYKLIHKLTFILSTQSDERTKKIVNFVGSCRSEYKVFDSFKIIPMALLNNALKYSLGNQNVEVHFEEQGQSTKISIVSIGPYLDDDEIKMIYQRGYRGASAKKINSAGMGIGLYVAQAAAQANGTTIKASSTLLKTKLNGHDLARNTFTFYAHDAPSRGRSG